MKGNIEFLDVIILVLILLSMVLVLPRFYTEMNISLWTQREDKTSLIASDVIKDIEYTETVSEIILALIVLDEYTPYPNAIVLDNTPVVRLDNTFYTNRYSMISTVYNPSGNYGYKLYENKEIESIEFVYPWLDKKNQIRNPKSKYEFDYLQINLKSEEP